ncbi:hypothetical protein SK128_001033 [Halocaridina rubra]|uniref:Uncharacterized protein n=1 Tax=Halocaridina rubra TaxID=373956 RepID=A0AAN8XDM9_HALRR
MQSYERATDHTIVNINPDLQFVQRVLSTKLTVTNIVRRHIFVLCSKKNIKKLLQLISVNDLENPQFWWVILTNEEIVEDIKGLIREGSQVLVIKVISQYSVKFYSTSVDNKNNISFIEGGSWRLIDGTAKDRVSPDLFLPITDFYKDFHGRQLLVKANNNPPFHGLKKLEDGTFMSDSGIDVSIVNALSQSLNFSWRVERPRDGKWGGPLPDGTVSGMIGEVSRREAHLAICEITITDLRETVVDFTTPYYFESLTIVTSAPPEKNRAFAILSPFPLQVTGSAAMVWLCISFAILILGSLLKIMTMIMKSYLNEKEVDERDKLQMQKFTLERFTFNIYRSLLIQSNLLETSFWPHRLVYIFWYLFCFYVLALYSATLTAVLITPSFEEPIDYLTDVVQAVEKRQYSLGVTGDSAFEYLFKEAKEGIYQKIYTLFNHKNRSKSFFSHPDVGFEVLGNENFIFFNSEVSSKIRAIKKGLDRYHFGRQTFYPQGYGIACNTGAPYREKFNEMLVFMREGGLISKWADEELVKVAGKSKRTSDTTSGRAKVISLKHLQAAFFILLIGFIFAGVVLMGENIYFRCQC